MAFKIELRNDKDPLTNVILTLLGILIAIGVLVIVGLFVLPVVGMIFGIVIFAVLAIAIFLTIALPILSLVGSILDFFRGVTKDDRSKSKKPDVKKFETGKCSSIVIDGPMDLYISQGKKPHLLIDADKDLLDDIHVKTSRGIMHISIDGDSDPQNPIRIDLKLPDIRTIKHKGVGSIVGQSPLFCDALDLQIEKTASCELEINCEKLDTLVNGKAIIELTGKAKDHELTIVGEALLDAFGFVVDNYRINTVGKGNINITCLDNLLLDITGSANISYKGKPEIDEVIVSEDTNIKKIDEE